MNQTLRLPLYITFFIILTSCRSLDTIDLFQNITDGETMVSENRKFELGFFSPGSSKNRYLGIWFRNTSPHTLVWVANREVPVVNTFGTLKLDRHGILSIISHDGTVWVSDVLDSVTNVNPVAQLLNNGNLVIKDGENSRVIWQSFDYTGDTFISGMKLGRDLVKGRDVRQTSWRRTDDPSPGEYSVRFFIDKGKYPQLYIYKNAVIETRIGPYDGIEFAGQPNYKRTNRIYSFNMVKNRNGMYFVTPATNSTISLKSRMTYDGKLEFSQLNTLTQQWMHDYSFPADYCDNYGLCGPYGSCSTAVFPNCVCLKGFELQKPQELASGCRRIRALKCDARDGFRRFSSVKLPDTQNAAFISSMNREECEAACRDRCSCTAYANPNVTSGGLGCLLWFGDLIDIRIYPQNGQELYVRLADWEEFEGNSFSQSIVNKTTRVAVMVLPASSALVLLFVVAYLCRKKKKRSRKKGGGNWNASYNKNISVQIEDVDELPFFSLREITKATDNFNIENKIGEGGFGPVYKGVLEDGQEVAVKRLSKTSEQGLDNFKNEVVCIAKLQHRNLVKLLGYFINGNEMILIYEYMANNSLGTFLFDEIRSSMLDWPRRFQIILGMARGILYLHQDSRVQIIHRDLKAGNILLDGDMNPKISDFGLARMFEGSDVASKTKKVVGTYGYISPEYAVHGRFSTKSDIFSFGVLVLEIVSGMKNMEFFHEDHRDNLLGHAWRLYKEGRSLELMSACLRDSCVISEVLRSIHVGLLCVQHHANDRPTMLSVVLMLGSEGALPQPKQPAFFTGESQSEVQSALSAEEYMITQLYAR